MDIVRNRRDIVSTIAFSSNRVNDVTSSWTSEIKDSWPEPVPTMLRANAVPTSLAEGNPIILLSSSKYVSGMFSSIVTAVP